MGGQINSITVPGLPEPIDVGDFVHGVFRSTVDFGTAQATDLTFFQNTKGQAMQVGPGCTATNQDFYYTNMPGQGYLPPGFKALVFFTSIVPPSNITIAQAQDIQDKCLFELINGGNDKVADDGWLSRYPQGGGLYLQGTMNLVNQVTNGFPSSGARTPYAVPHTFEALIPFKVSARFRAALALGRADTYTGCWVEGIIRRPVS